MIPKGQSDLTYHGTFFSLVIIYMMNLLLLALFLILGAPEVSFASFGRNSRKMREGCWPPLERAVRGVLQPFGAR